MDKGYEFACHSADVAIYSAEKGEREEAASTLLVYDDGSVDKGMYLLIFDGDRMDIEGKDFSSMNEAKLGDESKYKSILLTDKTARQLARYILALLEMREIRGY